MFSIFLYKQYGSFVMYVYLYPENSISNPLCMVKIAYKCVAGLYVAVIYLQMPHLQSNSSYVYLISSQPTFLPATVTVENHVMPQLRPYSYCSMMVQQDGAPPNSRTEICAYLSAAGVNWTWDRHWLALYSTNLTHLDSWRMCCTVQSSDGCSPPWALAKQHRYC